MLRAKLSFQLVRLISQTLPGRAGSRIVSLFRLKIPTTPSDLAAVLMVQGNDILDGIQEVAKKIGLARGAIEDAKMGALIGEILCAAYCLAVIVLGADDFASERGLFQLYTAKTFEELKELANKSKMRVPLEELRAETIELYLYDRPTLTELAQASPALILPEEVQKAQETKSWALAFALKAKFRILSRLDLDANFPAQVAIGLAVMIDLRVMIEKLFAKLRPALVV